MKGMGVNKIRMFIIIGKVSLVCYVSFLFSVFLMKHDKQIIILKILSNTANNFYGYYCQAFCK